MANDASAPTAVIKPVSVHRSMRLQEDHYGSTTISIPPFESHYPLTAAQKNILHDLAAFYTPDMIEAVLHPYAMQTSSVSLRCLDWLVTNFSKKNNIVCFSTDNELVNMYFGYKLALSNFRRRNFDPFRRKFRIRYAKDGEMFETTVGQANFLHWAHKNGVLKYAIECQTLIERDMNDTNGRMRKKKCNMAQKRRCSFSQAPKDRCFVYRVDTRILF